MQNQIKMVQREIENIEIDKITAQNIDQYVPITIKRVYGKLG